jgi:VWFA-related protein
MHTTLFNQRRIFLSVIIIATFIGALLISGGASQSQNAEAQVHSRDSTVTILVTAMPQNDRARAIAAKLQPEDFIVTEEKKNQRILSVKRASEAPPIIAVLIQDDLVSHVNNEIQCIKDFIREAPEGSRVMTAYISTGGLRVAQDFTTDRVRAAESLRIITGSRMTSRYSPYIQVSEALRRFDTQPSGRRLVLLVSDGLDLPQGSRNASPLFWPYLDQAISEAQRRGVVIFPFFAPSAGWARWNRLAVNYGQGALNRLADGTGGEAFFSGSDFVTFDPYFKELNELLDRQWLITYRSANTGSGFRRIEVTTDYDLHLRYPAGYRAREDGH